MARKPNYRFERMERDRAKAAKKAERAKSKEQKSATREPDTSEETPVDSEKA
jgi:hypothetical protein